MKKGIQTYFVMSYPVMSVYEFESFKEEKEVLDCWKDSSIYIICQRPVLYFDEIVPGEGTGTIQLKVKQRDKAGKLSVELSIKDNDQDFPGDTVLLEMNFFEKEHSRQAPYMNAAGIKLFNKDNKFIAWLSPERLIYDYIIRNMGFNIRIEGDIEEFLTYSVHYIGQAKNHKIWERLTGHEKLSKVLSVEHPFTKGEFSPYELSLIFLRLEGTNEIAIVDGKILTQEQLQKSIKAIPFYEAEPYAVNDCEAYLINLFEPKYNKRLYKNYPIISNGLKRLGFKTIEHTFQLFANLKTEEATMSIKLLKIKV